jgi:glycosyltransferase involved in cell wall biosynthesis
MKIVNSTIRYYPAVGGVEDYVRNLSSRLTKLGNKINIVTTDLNRHHTLERLEGVSKSIVDGIPVSYNKTLPFIARKYTLAPGMLFDCLRLNPDIIHGHSYMFCSADLARTASLIKNKPFVFNPYLSGENTPSLYGKLYRKIIGNSLFNADCVIVISPYEKELIHSWGFNPKRIEEVSPGVDLTEFDKSDNSKQDIYEKNNIFSEYKILFSGRIDYMKGIDVLVKAAREITKQIKDISFVITGPDFGYKKELLKMIKEYKLEKYFKFLGSVPRKDLIELYKQCSLFAFPSRYEAFGIVAAEAMAAKKAVVATNYSAIPNVVCDKETGLLFEKDNAKDLAEKVLLLLKDEKLSIQMGESGYNRVKQNYNWDKNAEKLNKIYKELI